MHTDPDAFEEASAAVPPRENIIRAVMPGFELRSDEDGGGNTLHGHFAVFDQWTEINSMWEGNFLERIAPGAFRKTFSESTPKVLFDHGQDPSIGSKPLGTVKSLSEDDRGAAYEVELLDTSYVRDLLPALSNGLLGASFRFRVMREDYDEEPKPGKHNPKGLPERTIREARVAEFGPVTFPAYEGATAGVRSLTDEHIVRTLLADPIRLRALLLELLPVRNEQDGEEPNPPEDDSAEPEAHPVSSRRESKYLFAVKETKPSWKL